MGRWRPPQAPSAPYITPEGYAALQSETRELWAKRGDVVQALAAAAAEGDRSENAEYIYRKKQLAEVDRRIRYLQKRLPSLKVVDQVADHTIVLFGAWVTLEDEQGEIQRHRIVGSDEIDPARSYISIDAPVARAVLRKAIDDEVRVEIGGTVRELVILNIEYDSVVR